MTVVGAPATDAARNAFSRGLLASGVSVNGLLASHNPQAAAKLFTNATDLDRSMCDAWLARIVGGEDSIAVLQGAWRARETLGWETLPRSTPRGKRWGWRCRSPRGTPCWLGRRDAGKRRWRGRSLSSCAAWVCCAATPWRRPTFTVTVSDGYGGSTAAPINVQISPFAANTVIATIPVGSNPNAVAVNPAGTLAYVTNNSGNSVSVIDLATNTVTHTITGFSSPDGVAVNPTGTLAYVTNAGPDSVSVIDLATNLVTATIGVGVNPFGVAVNPAGTRAYVANFSRDSVSVINLG